MIKLNCRYKARLVAQEFTERPRIHYEKTYSHVMNATIFCYLIRLTVIEKVDMRLIDVVIAYMYGSIKKYIYLKIP